MNDSVKPKVEYCDRIKQSADAWDIIVNYKSLKRVSLSIERFAKIINKNIITNEKLIIIKNERNRHQFQEFIRDYLELLFDFRIAEDYIYYTTNKEDFVFKLKVDWISWSSGLGGFPVSYLVLYKLEKSDLEPLKSQIVYYDDDAVFSYIIKVHDIVIDLSRFAELKLDIESFARITKMYFFTNKKMLVIHYLYNFDDLKELEVFINEILIGIFALKRKSDFVTLNGKTPFVPEWMKIKQKTEDFNSGDIFEYHVEFML